MAPACPTVPGGTLKPVRPWSAFRPKVPALSVISGAHGSEAERRPLRKDDEILAGVRRGDAGLAEDFYWRVKPTVDRTVRRLLGRLDCDGDDLVQMALIQLIESVASYRGECPLDAWVSAVSANVVYKHIRRRRLERTIFAAALEGDEEIAVSPKPSGVEAAQLREALRQIADHLTTMRPDRVVGLLAPRRVRLFIGRSRAHL